MSKPVDRGEGYLYRGQEIELHRRRDQAVIRFKPDSAGRPSSTVAGTSSEQAFRSRFEVDPLRGCFELRLQPIEVGNNPARLAELLPAARPDPAACPGALRALDTLVESWSRDPSILSVRPVHLDAATGRPLAVTGRLVLRLAATWRGTPAPAPNPAPGAARKAPSSPRALPHSPPVHPRPDLLPADSAFRDLLLRAESLSGARVEDYLGDGTWILGGAGPARDPLLSSARLAALPGVLWAEPDFTFPLKQHFIPDDPFFDLQQHLRNTGQNFGTPGADVDAVGAWDYTRGDSSITIAVLDNGVQTSHPDLRIKTGGRNFYPNTPTNNPNPVQAGEDHGTLVAGVAAARGNNALGVSGMAPLARVLPIKIAQGDLWANNTNIAKAIRYAADTGAADVINNSWGGGSPTQALTDAIIHASTAGRGGKGAIVLFSSGNSASDYATEFYPLWEFTPAPPGGRYRIGFRYAKNGSTNLGEDLASIDNFAVRGPDGYTLVERETFAGGIPAGWITPAGVQAWVSTSAMSYGGTGDAVSLRSPPGMTGNQIAEIRSPLRTWGPGETLQISVKVSSQAGGDLFRVRVYDSAGTMLAESDPLSGVPSGREDVINYPANADSAVAVGASTEMDFRSGYSQYRATGSGKTVTLVAPSNGLWSGISTTDRTGASGISGTDYTIGFGGTSSSAPLASGVAALVLARHPNLTRVQLLDVLKASCDKIGGVPYVNGVHAEYGYGRVNARKALAALDRPPVLAPVGNKAVAEGQILSFTLSTSDPDGDVATYSGLNLPPGVIFTGNTFAWTPGFNQTGNYAIRIVATTHALSDTESIVVTVGNADGPPDIAGIADTAILEDQALILPVTAVEPDGEPITWSWTGGPIGASFQGGSFAWRPTFAQAGVYDIRFIATSGTLSDTELVRITVTNLDRRPVIAVPGPRGALEAHLVDFTVSGSDADGDPVLIATLALPQGAAFDGSRFLWRPGYDQAGVHPVRFYALAGGEIDSADVVITVADAGSGIGTLRFTAATGTLFSVMPAGDGTGAPIGFDTVDFQAGVGAYWFMARAAGHRPVRFPGQVRSDTLLTIPVALKPHIPWLAGPPVPIPADGVPLAGLDSGAVSVDLDYDGNQDLLASGPAGVSFLRNVAATDEAEGLYARAGGYAFPPAAFGDLHAFDVDDWDNDGYYDFLVARRDGRILRAYLSPLGPTDTVYSFGDTATLATRPGKTCHPHAADRDGDGLRDLWLLCAEDGLWVYRNTGTVPVPALAAVPEEIKSSDGTSLAGLSSPLWVDLDADGAEELLAFRSGRLFAHPALRGPGNALAYGAPQAVNVQGSRLDCPGCRIGWRSGTDGMAYLLVFEPGKPARAHRTRLLGDLTGDGKADASDRLLLLEAWERRDGDPAWNPALNLALDPDRYERIDLRDLGVFGDSFGLEE